MLWGYQCDPLEMSISLCGHGRETDASQVQAKLNDSTLVLKLDEKRA